jgi:hypothetical protein
VTGTATCTPTRQADTAVVEGVLQVRGQVAECTWEMSDPRLSGPWTVTTNGDCHQLLTPGGTGQACVLWETIEAPGWTGSITTTVDASNHTVNHIVGVGTGPNAGWAFVGTNTSSEGFSGLLYQGPPPPPSASVASQPSPSPAG